MPTTVSIVTVTFNSAKHLASAIESVLAQQYPHIEYIVIDGASTDTTSALISHYKNNIACYICEPDNGIYDAINKGLALATGDIVGLLHADDLLESPSTIAQIVEQFDKSNCDLLYGDLLYVQENNVNAIFRYWKSGFYKPQKIWFGWMPPHPTVYVRRILSQHSGPYDTTFRIAADYDWLLRLLAQKPRVCYLQQVLVRMRVGGLSNKNATSIFQKMKEDYAVLKKNRAGGLLSLVCKNIRKIGQLWQKPSMPEHFSGDV